jgi:hypothetical protein
MGSGVAFPAEYYLPHLWAGWVVVSDERRNAEQLAATFSDPADALARLHAWCWIKQAERVYVKDDLTVNVSVHDFSGTEGATLAQRWFVDQRAKELGLTRDYKRSAQLEEEMGRINIEALDNIVIDALYNDTEYTLYAHARGGDLVVRVSVSGESSVSGRSREFVAYQVLAQVFGLDLFNWPSSVPLGTQMLSSITHAQATLARTASTRSSIA